MSQTNSPYSKRRQEMTWMDVWIKAITKPDEETYITISKNPYASSRTGYIWVFFSSFISFMLIALIGATFGIASELGEPLMVVFGLICAAPLAGILTVISFMISTAIVQMIAKAVGGSGTYDKLAYAFAAYTAPLSLASALFGLIPFAGLFFSFLSVFYGLVLNVIAVKAVHQFSWGQALLSSLLIVFLFFGCIAVMVVMFLTMLGPTIGNVFSNIITNL